MDLSGQASAGGPRFTNLVRLGLVDSTNTFVARALAEGADEGLVVVAAAQQAGRGRLGRTWHAPPSSALLCSIGFRPLLAVEQFHLVVTAVALAIRDAVAATAGVTASLKWPNDLIVGEQKLAGLLAEFVPATTTGKRPGLVVGLGVNVAWPKDWPAVDDPPEIQALTQSATTLARLSAVGVTTSELLESLVSHLEDRYQQLYLPGGGPQTMQAYREASSTIGRRVRVTEIGQEWEGLALAIDDDGRLIIDRLGERLAIDTADIVHLTQLGA